VDGKNQSGLNDSVFNDILTRNKSKPIARDDKNTGSSTSGSELSEAG